MRAAAALALAAALAACAPPAAPLPTAPPDAPAAPDAGRLADARAAFAPGAPEPDSFAAAALRAAGLTPPYERRFHVGPPGAAPLVAGVLPGGHPGYRDTLVVAVAVGPAGAAALLEAARMLAERTALVSGPPRTLLVALAFDGGAPAADAAAAAARALGAPLWAPASVGGLVAVGAGAGAAGAVAVERGLAFTAVEPGPAAAGPDGAGADGAALARAAYDALVAALRPPDPPLVRAADTAAAAR